MARIREPKAREPVWYLKVLVTRTVSDTQMPSTAFPWFLFMGHVRLTPAHYDTVPERSPQGCKYGERRHVIRLLEGPIVGGKGTSQGHLTQCRHKVGTPEEEEQVVELQHDQIFVVRTLAPIKGKQALGAGASGFDHRSAEVLFGKETGQRPRLISSQISLTPAWPTRQGQSALTSGLQVSRE